MKWLAILLLVAALLSWTLANVGFNDRTPKRPSGYRPHTGKLVFVTLLLLGLGMWFGSWIASWIAWVAVVIVAASVMLVIWLIRAISGGSRSAQAGLIAIVALVVAAVVGFGAYEILRADNASGSEQKQYSVEDQKQISDLLTVKTADTDCSKTATTVQAGSVKLQLVVYKIGATMPVVTNSNDGEHRRWSDAISTPLPGNTPAEQVAAQKAAFCTDPLVLVTWANFFANLTVDGVNIGDLNKDWLGPYKTDPSQINDQAAAFMPLQGTQNPNADQVNMAVQQNAKSQQLAGYMGTLLSRFAVVGDNSSLSTLNYHLTGGGLVAGGLPEVGLNPHQENLPVLQLSVTIKGACAPATIIGINPGDKRPEGFTPPDCASPSPSGKTSSPPSGCKTPCGTTSTTAPPGCTGPCTNTPTPPPSTTPPATPCGCPTRASQAPLAPPSPTRNAPTTAPAAPPTSHAPIVTGSPTVGSTSSKSAPAPTPSW